MYGSAGLGAAPDLGPAPALIPVPAPPTPPAASQAAWAAAISVIMLRRNTTFGPRPCAATPRYRRSSSALSETCRAKKESRRSGPGAGKQSTSRRLNRAWICFCAKRTVAVEAITFGRTAVSPIRRVHRRSIAVS